MPYSDGQGKDVAHEWYRRIAPSTVVDIGAGSGTYARKIRTPADGTTWTAIEAWEPYVAEFGLDQLYDRIVLADVRHLNWLDLRADLIILGDVLEHMTQTEARDVLRRAKQAAKNLIVSIPVLHLPQGAVNGNPYERHIEHWTATQMQAELDQHVDATVNGVGQVWLTLRGSWIGDVLAYFWWARP